MHKSDSINLDHGGFLDLLGSDDLVTEVNSLLAADVISELPEDQDVAFLIDEQD
jgi:hypothetical protein